MMLTDMVLIEKAIWHTFSKEKEIVNLKAIKASQNKAKYKKFS